MRFPGKSSNRIFKRKKYSFAIPSNQLMKKDIKKYLKKLVIVKKIKEAAFIKDDIHDRKYG